MKIKIAKLEQRFSVLGVLMNWNNSDRVNLQTDLIDGHVHLSDITHPGRAVENAVKAGAKRMIAVSMNLDSCRNCKHKCGKIFRIIKRLALQNYSTGPTNS